MNSHDILGSLSIICHVQGPLEILVGKQAGFCSAKNMELGNKFILQPVHMVGSFIFGLHLGSITLSLNEVGHGLCDL